MKSGNIVLIPLPQSDSTIKRRPALLLKQMPPFNDWLLCGISTQIQQKVDGFDRLLESDANYFPQTGLQRTSLIRLGFLAVVPKIQIIGSIGEIPDELLKELLQTLSDFIQPV
ncbi:type II toxin-antitoxin system PemK/MazF family toxin [Haliscomenobacter hydrossis]|uniref:Transcriptional modulator of MazE/toxin, MazF n=1 Tax=Haliscomenobacter hydrossis (strain ATCC 27775 / DSM 1100 / LMG 10767 / O) TaxID=760192 RepID=F4L2K7_HALH1|nr:type II toxin-antitoxin system PemK/MazF family toxin [Haliscomenobacter hydrossis]AEE53925.1 transcriptional modulator of MazE/toxin, MazF [Haliscomenobacter hydrossis DSM 1100]